MKMRLGLALVGAVGLTACAERDVAYNTPYVTDFGSYSDSNAPSTYEGSSVAMAAKWDGARDVTLTLRQNEFSPMIVHLTKGEAYNLTVVNKDKYAVSFKAEDFFENVSTANLSEVKAGDDVFEELKAPDLISFVVPAQSQRTVKFVPVLEGRYEFEDGAPGLMFPSWHLSPYSRGATQGSIGVFVVK